MMRRTEGYGVMVWKELSALRLRPELCMYIVVAAVIAIIFWIGAAAKLSARVPIGDPNREVIFQLLVNMIARSAPFPMAMLLAYQLQEEIFLHEKLTRTIETLLSSPITPLAVWLGKVSTVFLVTWIPTFAMCTTAIVLIGLRYMNMIIMPDAVALFGLLAGCPIMFMFWLLLSNLMVLVLREPRFLPFVSFAILSATLYRSVKTFQSHSTQDLDLLLYIVGVLGCVLVILIGLRVLTRERIVSS